jgi:hypothetical protein
MTLATTEFVQNQMYIGNISCLMELGGEAKASGEQKAE